ncbi:DUF1488 domain-containing protein [Shewanella corallii]|uniref:DUF1488 domain-containing protein n=2 Tax=Shewanella TaxID=22 RepID=A0ABT0NEP3_9GAMM|nr:MULTISPECIES: DUF1488 domain-containing protein [Shewanella]MCL1039775.1 DUF1488 domain-containing protein [Shewanella submarina]MCL2916336.1 DUF1488 domain-containing protein [Shewanella corallii]
MNQSVLFPDLQSWDADKQQMVFPVQVEGRTLFCVIGLEKLSAITGVAQVDADNVLDVFSQARFDIEDLAEQKLESEEFTPDGHVFLG